MRSLKKQIIFLLGSIIRIGTILGTLIVATLPATRGAYAYSVCGPDITGCQVISTCLAWWCASDSATGSGQCVTFPRGTHKCVQRQRNLLDKCSNQTQQPCCSIEYADFDMHKDCAVC